MGKGIEKENKNHRFLGLEIKNKKRFLIFFGHKYSCFDSIIFFFIYG